MKHLVKEMEWRHKIDIQSYADDLVISSRTDERIDIGKVMEEFEEKGLTMNLKKCASFYRKVHEEIPLTNHYKYLGIEINDVGRVHRIEEVWKKVRTMAGMIRRAWR